MTVSLHPLSKSDYASVAHIRVASSQVKYSGQVEHAFRRTEPLVDFHMIANGGHPVGFFKIDRGFSRRYRFAARGDLGLRAFLIDEGCQGHGIGGAAARGLHDYIHAEYPDAPVLWLTVNTSNPGAIRVYTRAGFIDTGEMYLKGNAGPQHVMRLSLPQILE